MPPIIENKLAYGILLVFLLLSLVVPYFSIIVLAIAGILFFKIRPKRKEDYFTQRAIIKCDTFAKYKAFKQSYLKSYVWKTKRTMTIERDHFKCATCDATENLEVHHLNGYGEIPFEDISSLVTLCRDCHQKQHEIHGYPSTLAEYMEWNVDLVK